MGKIGFVTPWHGENIPGGAEAALRSITNKLKETELHIEILTTCVEKFASDWNVNYFKPGVYQVNGITTRRFPVRKRDVHAFDRVNAKLINHEAITEEEEEIFLREMVNSPELYQFMEQHIEEYDLFVFIPYMFGTTYYGSKVCYGKSVHIPCAHEEPYIHMKAFRDMFEKSRGIIYNSLPEKLLVDKLFDMSQVNECVAGLGMDVNICGNADTFRNKYNIKKPYILYAGRKDIGKNVNLLLKYFREYKLRNRNEVQLVLIGGGNISIPKEIKDQVHDLGFVDIQDKYDAYAGAVCLCQPSTHESFSYVIMESWICCRPVLVHEYCDVTKNFAVESKGGLYFNTYFDFEGCINYYLNNKDIAQKMGQNGCEYVRDNFRWDIILDKYNKMIKECCKRRRHDR